MSKILITWVGKPYEGEFNGKEFQSLKITYLPKNATRRSEERGYNPVLRKLRSFDLLEKITVVPGVYDMETEMYVNSKNQEEHEIVDLELIKPIDFVSIFED